jgi:hypothetical protein
MMLQALISPLTSLAGTWLNGKVEQKAAETKAKVARAEAEAQIMVSRATSEADWEKIMAQGSNHSWKDELYAIIFAIPLCLAFAGDWGRTVVENGFHALDACPDWYKAALGIIISASFASRQASKFFGNK